MRNTKTLVFLFSLLVAIAGLLFFALSVRPVPTSPPAMVKAESSQYLAAAENPKPGGFRVQDVPSWLFVHVAIIAMCQVMSLVFAVMRASRGRLTKQDVKAVQFLCEIPMYLGLFGTLMGVCLTQFISGSLVAPMAYLTTMCGIVLHVFGKLFIWLPLPGGRETDD